MTVTGWIQIVVLVAAVTLLTPPLGGYIATPTSVIYLVGLVVAFAVLTFLTALALAPFAQALSSRLLG